MADKLRVRIVDDVVTTNTAGGVVESLPVLVVEGPVQNTVGTWVDPIEMEEADDGLPIRIVTEAVVLNSVGQPVAAIPGEGVGGSIISSVFADGTDGFYFDFSKTDQLFQTVNGGAAADGAGENIALALEAHAWSGKTIAELIAAAAEKCPNGDFATSDLSAWTRGFNNVDGVIAVVGGQLQWTKGAGDGANPLYVLPITGLTSGSTYSLNVGAVGGTAGDRRVGVTASSDGTGSATGILSNSTGRRYFLATATTMYLFVGMIGASTGQTLIVDDLSIKESGGNHGRQATTAAQPKWQTGGVARFDGSDDYLTTALVPAETMTIMAKFNTSLLANRVVLGAFESSGAKRASLGIAADGKLAGYAGDQTDATGLKGSASILGAPVVGALVIEPALATLYQNGVQIAQVARGGNVPGVASSYVGGINVAGTVQIPLQGDIYFGLEIKKALTAAQIAAITNLWGTT